MAAALPSTDFLGFPLPSGSAIADLQRLPLTAGSAIADLPGLLLVNASAIADLSGLPLSIIPSVMAAASSSGPAACVPVLCHPQVPVLPGGCSMVLPGTKGLLWAPVQLTTSGPP